MRIPVSRRVVRRSAGYNLPARQPDVPALFTLALLGAVAARAEVLTVRSLSRRMNWLAVVAVLVPATAATAVVVAGRVGPAYDTTVTGRVLEPAGRMTTVGDFPSGGALTPDGRYYWAVDSGHGRDDVTIVSVATGKVTQVLP